MIKNIFLKRIRISFKKHLSFQFNKCKNVILLKSNIAEMSYFDL